MVTGFWADAPPGRVTCLVGAVPAAVALGLDPLPAGAPATVTWRPAGAAVASRSMARVVGELLGELEAVAAGLFPAWLPAAGGLDGRDGARVPAVRALAMRRAATTEHFGPFLADLAEWSLDRAAGGPPVRFSAEVRAAGLARVLADSFQRRHAALLVDLPDSLSPDARQVLLDACEWLAHHGGFAVWLAGSTAPGMDRPVTVAVRLPGHAADADGAGSADRSMARDAAGVAFPPLAGRPHPASAAEQALEAALADMDWARGRVWNQTYQPHTLTNPVRVDLMWERERCVVEIDGPEHCGAVRFEADRRRDVLLQLAGFAVLRFTNAQVHLDLTAVLSQLERFLTTRRRGKDQDVP